MNSKYLAILVIGLLTAPLAAIAERIQSTTSVTLTFRQCVAGTTVCDSIGPSQVSTYGGLPGDLVATASQIEQAYGEASANAKLNSAPGAAELSASVSSFPATRNGSNSTLMKRYTNTNSVAQTLTFNGTLTYNQTVPVENASFPADGPVKSGVFSEIVVITLNDDFLEAGTTAEENYLALMSEPPPDAEATVLESAKAESPWNVTEGGTGTMSTTVTLQPGDSIWLWAILQSLAANGAVVDADLVIGLQSTSAAP